MTNPLTGKTRQQQLGAFYTGSAVAGPMVRWAIRSETDRILEPSMGDGSFLREIADLKSRGYEEVEVFGAELDPHVFRETVAAGLVDQDHAFNGDFLRAPIRQVDVVVGNPPFVRLRHLPNEQAGRALDAATGVLGRRMDPSGSLWMPFILQATRHLAKSGRMALVVPWDISYVRYARPLWEFLGNNFEALTLARVRERMFPDLLQESAILLADGYGGATEQVMLRVFERTSDLFQRSCHEAPIQLSDIVAGERAFLNAMLSPRLRSLLSSLEASFVNVNEVADFNIGYVAGDKSFFHPDPATIEQFALEASSLRPAIASSRRLKSIGVRTSELADTQLDWLFLPDTHALTEGDRKYIAHGATLAVNSRYKCRTRSPWYLVPGVRTPDLLLTVFSDAPQLLLNDAGIVASNSMLCGYLKPGLHAELVVLHWYSSLTLLQAELQIHSLGGGVLIAVPREVAAMRLLSGVAASELSADAEKVLKAVEDAARFDLDAAYQAGDELLRAKYSFTEDDLALLHSGIETLRQWRRRA